MKVLKEKDLHVGMKIRVMLNVNPDAAVWGGYYLPAKKKKKKSERSEIIDRAKRWRINQP